MFETAGAMAASCQASVCISAVHNCLMRIAVYVITVHTTSMSAAI